jgi:hypothetical protein
MTQLQMFFLGGFKMKTSVYIYDITGNKDIQGFTHNENQLLDMQVSYRIILFRAAS